MNRAGAISVMLVWAAAAWAWTLVAIGDFGGIPDRLAAQAKWRGGRLMAATGGLAVVQRSAFNVTAKQV